MTNEKPKNIKEYKEAYKNGTLKVDMSEYLKILEGEDYVEEEDKKD